MSRELLQQALDALENHRDPLSEAAGNALRAALAAPQPEPYGHITTHAVTGQQFFYRYPSPPYLDTAKECIAVYAAPPAAPAPAVPLTDDIVEKEFVSRGDGRSQGLHPYWKSAFREGWHFARAMIAASPPAPAVAEPLSDERIDEIFEGAHENMPKGVLFRTFIARAIEQAHGIGGGGK